MVSMDDEKNNGYLVSNVFIIIINTNGFLDASRFG